jgi:hypothetical protein
MLQLLVNVVALVGALAALLSGMARGAPLASVLKRTLVGYLVVYAAAAVFAALVRVGLASNGRTEADTPGRGRAARGTGGTNTAD